MSTHSSVAAAVRRRKERKPQEYCADPRCLWNVKSSGPCPHHQPVGHAAHLNDVERKIIEALRPMEGDREAINRVIRTVATFYNLEIR